MSHEQTTGHLAPDAVCASPASSPARPAPSHGGLGAINAERFDVAAAVGGWRGALESVLPTLVFILVLALRPTALVPALLASLALSAVGLVARLAQRQSLNQVLSGAVLAAVSALWAWRSGEAANFYATGLLINAGWLGACLLSLLVGFPLVGVLMELCNQAATEGADKPLPQEPGTPEPQVQAPSAPEAEAQEPGSQTAGPSPQPPQEEPSRSWFRWRQEPRLRGQRRRYYLGTMILAAMFALRLVVEVPLYLAGEPALGALGVARLALGVPLFVVTLWLVWTVVRPEPERH